jgi:hypothetical protein
MHCHRSQEIACIQKTLQNITATPATVKLLPASEGRRTTFYLQHWNNTTFVRNSAN